MKLQVFVRSAAWLETAGTRIRYQRLQSELARLGCACAIDPISSVREGLKLGADVYLFSKCHDAGALMMADMLREAGALVGFDLFDDYISGQESLTFGQRAFQRGLRGRVDFMLCSTPQMALAARAYDQTTPVHVLNDPVETFAPGDLARLLQAKLDRARTTRRLDVVWFGQAGNPLFPVGLSDLIAFGDRLGGLARAGWQLQLQVLTNDNGLDPETLAGLRQLPVPVELRNWSLDRERAALQQAALAFIPVNYQPFSTAKSLNRAVTALSHGAQVLSPGYELYADLDPFIYADEEDLSRDLDKGILRLRPETTGALTETFSRIADPAAEAVAFVSFLNGLPPGSVQRPVRQRRLRAILHGAETVPATGGLCRALGWLSLASPYCALVRPFHAAVALLSGRPEPVVVLTKEAIARLTPQARRQLTPLNSTEAAGYSHCLPLPAEEAGQRLAGLSPAMVQAGPLRAMTYRAIMAATEAVFLDLFGDMIIVWSELEPHLVMAQEPGDAEA